MAFEFSSLFDLRQAQADFAEGNKTRIADILEYPQALSLSETAQKVDFKQVCILDNEFRQYSAEEIHALNPAQRKELITKIFQQASEGVGYWYGKHTIGLSSPAALQDFSSWLNSDTVLENIRKITGFDDITGATAQVSRFLPGDFLTRHQDVNDEQERRVAFVMHLTTRWHPDWGGLLQFFEPDGTPTDVWSPEFNSLSLLDVKHILSTTCVSPFSPIPGITISGWFNAR